MLLLPDGVTEEIYQRAVMFAIDWRPGQRCTKCKNIDHYRASPDNWLPVHRDHDLPLPPLTDELLMAMLEKGIEHDCDFLLTVHSERWAIGTESPAAAIILAAASMETK